MAFQSTFYAFTKSQGCVKCHAANVSPHFASPDVNNAYGWATGFRNGSTVAKLIDFDNPLGSVIIDYAGNSHCSDTPCSNPDIRPVIQNVLETWAAAEKAIGSGGSATPSKQPKFFTGSLKVPGTIPNIFGAAPAVLRFPLSALKPAVPGLQNAIFEIEVQMVNDFEYRLSKPKIAGNTISISVKDITVYIKQTDDPLTPGNEDSSLGLNWHSIEANSPIFVIPSPLPNSPLGAQSLAPLPIYFQTSTKADYFTLGFAELK